MFDELSRREAWEIGVAASQIKALVMELSLATHHEFSLVDGWTLFTHDALVKAMRPGAGE